FFHVDAAFGGFVLPFLKELGYPVPAWDFSVKSVDSITADPHKMGLGIIPSGGYLIKDASILKKIGFEIPYLAGGNFKHFHIVGTRPGSPIIAFWAILKLLGVNGFKEIVKKCMENTKFLVQRISEIEGLRLAVDPVMNVVGITTESGKSICEVEKLLCNNKWMLGKFQDFNLVRVVIMPHVKRDHLIEFSYDLEKIVKKLKL
ncbi:MAG: pyridoxal-dependent decarboxylase, partial [Promethearchaeota archaeon]